MRVMIKDERGDFCCTSIIKLFSVTKIKFKTGEIFLVFVTDDADYTQCAIQVPTEPTADAYMNTLLEVGFINLSKYEIIPSSNDGSIDFTNYKEKK